jgi:hypothetical protein
MDLKPEERNTREQQIDAMQESLPVDVVTAQIPLDVQLLWSKEFGSPMLMGVFSDMKRLKAYVDEHEWTDALAEGSLFVITERVDQP